MRIDIARQRGQGSIWHADGNGRHMLEGIGHRHKQDVHRVTPHELRRWSPTASEYMLHGIQGKIWGVKDAFVKALPLLAR